MEASVVHEEQVSIPNSATLEERVPPPLPDFLKDERLDELFQDPPQGNSSAKMPETHKDHQSVMSCCLPVPVAPVSEHVKGTAAFTAVRIPWKRTKTLRRTSLLYSFSPPTKDSDIEDAMFLLLLESVVFYSKFTYNSLLGGS